MFVKHMIEKNELKNVLTLSSDTLCQTYQDLSSLESYGWKYFKNH